MKFNTCSIISNTDSYISLSDIEQNKLNEVTWKIFESLAIAYKKKDCRKFHVKITNELDVLICQLLLEMKDNIGGIDFNIVLPSEDILHNWDMDVANLYFNTIKHAKHKIMMSCNEIDGFLMNKADCLLLFNINADVNDLENRIKVCGKYFETIKLDI